VSQPFDITNWLQGTKSFKLVVGLEGLAINPVWDFTNPDGTGGGLPGENPARIQQYCTENNIKFNNYWCRRVWQSGVTSLSCGQVSGDASISLAMTSGFPPYKNTSDDLFYLGMELTAAGGSDDTSWNISGFSDTFGDHVADFEWVGGSAPLYGNGSGAAGTIKLLTVSKWS